MTMNWPSAAIILGIVFLILFRRQIAGLLDRTEKIKDWLTAPKAPAQISGANQSLISDSNSNGQKQLEELTARFDNQVLLAQEQRIILDIQQYGLTATNQAEKLLVRHLAGTQIVLHLERAYTNIFGSQVRLLRWLNEQVVPVTRSRVKEFYEQTKREFPVMYESYPFENYLGYLVSLSLVEETETSRESENDNDSSIHITLLGREFLKYLIDQGKTEDRIG